MTVKRFFRLLTWTITGIVIFGLTIAIFLTSVVFRGFKGTIRESDLPKGRGVTCGLVFGAAVHRGSLPGPGIKRRVRTAARLYKEGLLQHIILTGGKGSQEVDSEAEVMEQVALQDGVAAGDLTLEPNARSTWENLLFSRPLTGSCDTVIGISDRYHLTRISYLAHKQGWEDIRTLPSDIEPSWPFELKSVGREVAALLYYMIITKLFPLNEIAQHGFSLNVHPPVLGLLITKSDHLVCQLIY
ncbi:MAG: YdcF family protein [Candidatus Peribacteraceae bacterium]|nr:YdcF family protein [Candidatus Peribacteraceae bacterium]